MNKKPKKLTEKNEAAIAEEFFYAINGLELPFAGSAHLVVNIFLNFFRNCSVSSEHMVQLLEEMKDKYIQGEKTRKKNDN